MPLDDILKELGLQFLFEIVFYGITYWTGFIVLKIVSIGNLDLAPFSTWGDRNKGRFFDMSIWLDRGYGPRVLRMETVCIVGFLFWISIGVLGYFYFTT